MIASTKTALLRRGWLAALPPILAACGGGTSDDPPIRDCTCGDFVNICLDRAHIGTKSGTATSSVAGGGDVFVVVDDDGTLRVMGIPGIRASGQITSATRCGRVSGTIQAWAEPGVTFRDGTTTASGTLTGNSEFLGLAVEWVLSSGDTGGFDVEVMADRTAPAEQAGIAGQWLSETAGAIRGSFEIGADGTVSGQDVSACDYAGRFVADGSNTLGVTLSISSCGLVDGNYLGVAVAESLSGDRNFPTLDALWIHVDRPGNALVDRWTRP